MNEQALETKEIHGHTFKLISESGSEIPCSQWKSVDEDSILVIHPCKEQNYWTVCFQCPEKELVHVIGGDAEKDAFSMAVTFIKALTAQKHRLKAPAN